MEQYSKELQTAITAAKKSAEVIFPYFQQGIDYTFKDDNTVLTKADSESEQIIKSAILEVYSDAKFLAEESGGERSLDKFWIIDPIDGTRSFSRGVPTWNILIALCEKGEIRLGISYFPALNQLIVAEQGQGAYLDGRKVRVSNIDKVSKAYIGTGSPRHFKNKQILIDLIERAGTVRSFDLTFTNLLIAKGSMDGIIDSYGMIWDLAPYKVIVEEAGGRITRLDGSEWKTDESKGCVISNALIHDELLEIIANNSI